MYKQGRTTTVLGLLGGAQAVFIQSQGVHSICCYGGGPGGSARGQYTDTLHGNTSHHTRTV